jgi:CO dehydrogenase nickel-insertion accessory protein CooC1
VLNKVPDTDTEHFLWQRLLEGEINAVVSIREDPDLRQAWLEGIPLHSAAAEAEAAKIVRALEQKRGGFAAERTVQSAAEHRPSPQP